jgi:hypothetical protein
LLLQMWRSLPNGEKQEFWQLAINIAFEQRPIPNGVRSPSWMIFSHMIWLHRTCPNVDNSRSASVWRLPDLSDDPQRFIRDACCQYEPKHCVLGEVESSRILRYWHFQSINSQVELWNNSGRRHQLKFGVFGHFIKLAHSKKYFTSPNYSAQ